MATNLEFIKSASGTSVSSLSVTDCFSAKYDVYTVVGRGDFTNSNAFIYLRFLDSGGSEVSASNYDYANLVMESYASFGESRTTNADHLERIVYSHNGNDFGFEINIYNPYDSSSYSFCQWQSGGRSSLGLVGIKSIGVLKQTATMSGIKIYNPTFTDINVSVYGVK